jgi:hypothetical protein
MADILGIIILGSIAILLVLTTVTLLWHISIYMYRFIKYKVVREQILRQGN